MKKKLLALLLAAMPAMAFAGPEGVWRTENNEDGNYLHVEVFDCGGNYCGKIVKVSTGNNAILGKQMIWDMKPAGENRWSGGKIWAADTQKTYNSKMSLSGDVLRVEGCVAVLCRGQNWTRVQ